MKFAKIVSLLLLGILMITLGIPAAVMADNETLPENVTPLEPDTITLTTTYPKIEGLSGSMFQFSVSMTYKGVIDRLFDLKATPPTGWTISVTPLYETGKKISSISMESSELGKTQSLLITAIPNSYEASVPGNYTITLEAFSGELSGKIDLTATVTASYSMVAEPAEGIYSLKAKSGRNSVISLNVINIGTAPIENVTFVADKTQGWEISFSTEKIDVLETGGIRTVDLNIKPANKTVSGDYVVNVWVNGKQASSEKISIRVTVETSSIWGWVGVIIILIVVAGLVFIFVRFGRR